MWLTKKWRDKIASLTMSLDETRTAQYHFIKSNSIIECESCGCLIFSNDFNKLTSTVEQEDIYGHGPSYYYPGIGIQMQQTYQPTVVGKKEVIKSHYRCKRCRPPGGGGT